VPYLKNLFYCIVFVVGVFILLSASVKDKPLNLNEEIFLWENQLNELNFLVIRISAANLINGLNLSNEQIIKLLELQKRIDILDIKPQKTQRDLLPEITQIRTVYSALLENVLHKNKIPEELKKEVFETRLVHSLLIKKTLIGKSKTAKTPLSCIQCHALPRHFPKEDVKQLKNKTIMPWQRYKIDKTHALGLLTDAGNIQVWYAKDLVDSILTPSQKFIAKHFTCCLIPPDELSDPMRAGQAFSTDDWIKYLREIRQYDRKTWRKYKHLYVKPLEDIILAVLPSITEYNKQKALYKMTKILEEVREMDDITFELQKENVCKRFEACYNFDDITGVTKRSKKIELYVNAMFLLFPGNTEQYRYLLSNQ